MVNPDMDCYTKAPNHRKILRKCKVLTYWKTNEY